MRGFSFSSLRVRLILLVFLAVIPTLGLVIHMAWEERRLLTSQVQDNTLRLARRAALDQQELIEGARQLLLAVTRLPAVRNGNQAECNALFADLLIQHPHHANFAALGPTGDLFCSALPARATNLSDQPFFQRAVQMRSFVVGEYQIDRISRIPTINLGYPVLDAARQVRAVVFAALDLAWLNQLASQVQLPEGAVIMVIDRKGTILARHPNPEKWIGKSLEASFVKSIINQGEGMVEALDPGGVERLFSYTSVGDALESSLYLIVGLSKEVVFAEVNQLLTRSLIMLGIVSLFAVAAAWLEGHLFILRPASALVSMAKKLSVGHLSARTGLPYGQGELNQLACVLDEMAESLEQRTCELEKANQVKTQFLSVISHELRTPLNVIMGFTGILRDEMLGEVNLEQKKALGKVMRQSNDLLAMITGIIEATKIEVGAEVVESQAVDLRSTLDSLRFAYDVPLDKELTLVWDYPTELPSITTDSGKLKQILQNLINNAIKFTEKGHVTISARCIPGTKAAEIKVADTGIGIPNEVLPFIFEIFHQADSSETRNHGGVGLGLYIVKRFADLLGGKVEVESDLGKGSTFTVTIPL